MYNNKCTIKSFLTKKSCRIICLLEQEEKAKHFIRLIIITFPFHLKSKFYYIKLLQ